MWDTNDTYWDNSKDLNSTFTNDPRYRRNKKRIRIRYLYSTDIITVIPTILIDIKATELHLCWICFNISIYHEWHLK